MNESGVFRINTIDEVQKHTVKVVDTVLPQP